MGKFLKLVETHVTILISLKLRTTLHWDIYKSRFNKIKTIYLMHA